MKTDREILVEARALLTDPKKWCQGTIAARWNGMMTDPSDPTACSFCAIGAIQKVSGTDRREISRVESALLQVTPPTCTVRYPGRGGAPSVPIFNDDPNRTHDEILELFDRAIDRCPE